MKMSQCFCAISVDSNYIFSLFLVLATFRITQLSFVCFSFFVSVSLFVLLIVCMCVCLSECSIYFFKNAIFRPQVFLSLNHCKKQKQKAYLKVNMAKKAFANVNKWVFL